MNFTIDENTGAVVPRGTAQMGVERQIPRFEIHQDDGAVPCADGDYVEFADHAAEVERLMTAIEMYRSAHKDCKDLTGHPDAMKSQRRDWRCDACKIADEYRTPRTDQQLQPKGEQG